MSVWGTIVNVLAMHAEALSNGNGITNGLDRNAIAHAHTSAQWAQKYGRTVAETLGELK